MECRLKVRDDPEVWDDGRGLYTWGRVNQIHIVSESDPAAAGDLEHLVFDIAIERDVYDGGGRLSGSGYSHQLSIRDPCGGERAPLPGVG